MSFIAFGQTTVSVSDANLNYDECWISGGLYLDGNTSASDISYQWEISTTGSSSGWSNYTASDAQNPSITVTAITGQTWFKRTRTYSGGLTADVIIEVNPQPVVSATDYQLCVGETTTLTLTGSSSGTWSNSNASASTLNSSTLVVTGVASGTSVYTYTDTYGCNASVSIQVNALPTVSAGPDQSVCSGGSVTLEASGASTYTWNNGVTNDIAFVPTATQSYTVTGTNSNGCSSTDDVIVTVNSAPTITAPETSVCIGSTIDLDGSGTPATSGAWSSSSNGIATVNSNGLVAGVSAGSVTITYTDINGCTATQSITVNSAPLVSAGTSSTICSGDVVTLSGSGASTYTWDNGITNGQSISPTTTTTYTVTGTDANGCSATNTLTITVRSLPSVSAGSDQTVCSGGDVTLSGSGASTYTWNNGVSNGVVFNPTVTKTYTVTGTDANGCVNTDDVVVTVLSLPSISGATDVCIGASTTLSGSGTASSSSPWLSSHPSVATVTSSGVVTGVSGGTTTITYTDNNGCQVEETVTVNGLPSISAGSDVSTCAGSAVTLSGSGGTSYVWNNSVTNGVSFVPTSTTTYTVTGTDANGCENTDDVVVTVNALPTISGTTTVCVGSTTDLDGSGTPATSNPWTSSNTGIATINSSGLVTGVASGTTTITYTNSNNCSITTTVTVNGGTNVSAGADLSVCSGTSVTLSGTGASSYSWDNGVTNGTAFTPTTTATYTVTGTDGNGCVTTDDVVVTVNALPSVSAGNDEAICDGDQITLSGSGASTYSWSGGVTNGTAFTPGSTATYTVTGTDGNGCVNTDQVTITVNTLPTVSAGSDQTVCAGEQVTLSGSGANSYSWTNSVTDGQAFTPSSTTTYTVTGTDGNGCTATDDVTVTVKALPVITGTTTLAVGTTSDLDGTGTAASSNAWTSSNTAIATVNPSTGLVQGVAAGSVTITYTDSDGCSKTQTVTITPLPIISGTLSVCVGSTTDLDGTGTAASSSPWTSSAPSVATVTSAGVVAGLSAGTTTITYTDSYGGSSQQTVTVYALPSVSAGSDQTVCSGGDVTLSGSGASTYTWNNGVSNGVVFNPTVTKTYTVTGTDANGCVNTDDVVVTVLSLPSISGATDVCIGASTTLSGSGTASSSSPWLSSHPSVATVTSSGVVTGVSGGTTTITYTDNNGCQVEETVTVNGLPSISAGSDVSTCAGSAVTLSGSGGTSYVWNNSVTNGVSFVPTSTTTYTVTGTDANGCENTDDVVVTVNALPTISGTTTVCVGSTTDLDGSGTPATSNPWTSSNTGIATVNSNGLVTGVSGGSVTITYTDNNGCSKSTTVLVHPQVTVEAGNNQSICIGDGVTLTATGATSYSWDNGITNGTAFTPTETVTYTVTGTDANGCTATDNVTVSVVQLPTISGSSNVCVGGSITLSGYGSAATPTPWSSSNTGVATVDGSGVVTGVGVGQTTITYTNADGCEATHVVTCNQSPTISGTLETYVGGTTALTGVPSGGTWSSSSPSIFTISSNGTVTGVSAGTATASYTLSSGCVSSETITIHALPTISGTLSVCVGSTTDLDGTGTAASSSPWTSSAPSVATVTSAGVVAGLSAGTTTITYTDSYGGSSQQTVTVYALPSVSAGSDQTVCSGGDVTLSGSGASTYTWNNGVSNGVVFNPTVTKTYTVTGTDANGCVNTDDVVVTVLSLPSISGATDVCIGASTTLSGSGTASSSSPWLSSHPSVATVTSSGVVTGVSGGTTTITYTDNNGCQVEETVTVNGLPSISAGSDVSTCAGSAVTLSGSGGTSYVWNNSVTNGVSFVPTSTTTYTVTGTDANGCENTDDVVVTVNALPTISGTTTVCVGSTTDLDGSGTPATSNPWTSSNTGIATINSSGLVTGVASGTTTITYTNSNNCSITTTVTVNGGTNVSAGADLSVCSGTSVTLSGTGASSYSWDNGVTNGTAFTPTTTATYTVTGTDGNGCVTTDDVVVTVNALPSVSAGNDEAICDGDQITLSGSGASTYSWSGGVTNGTAFTPGSTATYTVTGTDGNGCVNTDQVTITVNTLPTVSAGSDQTVCAGEQVTLSGSGANSYSWTNSVTDGQAFTPSSTTTYTVTGTDGNGCTATDDVTVTVKALPVITGTTTLAVGTTSDLDGTGTAAQAAHGRAAIPVLLQ